MATKHGTDEISSRTAWMTVLLLSVQVSLGLFQARTLTAAGKSARSTRVWALTGHTIIGLSLLPLAFAHACFSMKLPGISGTSVAGLWFATAVLLLLAAQAMTGLTMLPQKGPRGVVIRRIHFAMAVLLAALVSAHVFLNG